jgi:hypothetical protein
VGSLPRALFRERAVAYHAAVDAAHAAGLARRVRREVVVMHESAFWCRAPPSCRQLRVARAAERERGKHVRAAAIKDARAVEYRRDAACFCKQRAHSSKRAVVGALVVLDCAAMDLFVYFVFKKSL